MIVRKYQDGDMVQINKPTLREHGRIGKVHNYDDLTGWYWIEFDSGPPWRGKYEAEEIATPNESDHD